MTSELRIALSLTPQQDTIALAVRGEKVPDGLVALNRTLLKLDEADMEDFRRGVIGATKFGRLSEQLTSWLLDDELKKIVKDSIENGARVRLVFVVKDQARGLLAGLPFELLWYDQGPLIMRNAVQSVVYKLEKSPGAASTPATNNWPFRVLIVRSNPVDLIDHALGKDGQVPEVAPLRQHILNEGAHYGLNMVQVDVISNEPAVGDPCTWTALQKHLRKASDYNVLVYLGHGEIIAAETGGEPVGQLFLESEDGGGHQPISSPQLAKLLSRHPIPVVILTGCLTAAETPGMPIRLRGGEQGVAQALVNSSEAGVQIAIGMRTEVRTDAAMLFLESFFASLLNSPAKGNVDRAAWEARNDLYLARPFPPSWAAPVVFRATEQEPAIDYLARPVDFSITAEMEKLMEVRSALWRRLPEHITAAGGSESLPGMKAALGELDLLLRKEARQHGAALMPDHIVLQSAQANSITVQLEGQLAITKLTGRVLIGGNAASVTSIAAMGGALDPTMRFLTDPNDLAFFELQSRNGQPAPLQAGDLLKVNLLGNQAEPNLYPITLEIQKVEPKTKLWPGDNILVVPRP